VSMKADDPSTREGRQYHIQCNKGDLAKYLLVPGNPERIPKIVEQWEQARDVAYHREFRSVTGKYKGTDISAISSGIGSACMAIVVHEATALGVDTFIRVGSTGAIGQGIECGDLVISSAAVRLDGVSQSYVLPEYPAHASYEVLMALVEAAKILRKHVNPFVQYFELGEDTVATSKIAEEETEEQAVDEELAQKLSMPIQELELSVRANNCLESAKTETVGQLVKMTEADLLKIRSFGKTSLREIKRKLADIGLSLGMTDV